VRSLGAPSHETSDPGVVPSVRSRFELLIDVRGPALLRTLTSLVGRNDAEDIWQETFLAALRAVDRMPTEDGEERAWLWTIAHHKAIDHWRKTGKATWSELPDDSGANGIPLADEDPSEELVARLADQSLWASVKDLPTKQRICIAYRYLADLSFHEIGALVGCSEDAARRSVYEGIVKLRKAVAV
jgi:RNA polymerase sigma factor (sigma-70 family)